MFRDYKSGRRRPRTSGEERLSAFLSFWRFPPQSVHQIITLRTSRTLREAFFGGLRPRPGSVFGCERGDLAGQRAAEDCREPVVQAGFPAQMLFLVPAKVARSRATSRGGYRLRQFGMHTPQRFLWRQRTAKNRIRHFFCKKQNFVQTPR